MVLIMFIRPIFQPNAAKNATKHARNTKFSTPIAFFLFICLAFTAAARKPPGFSGLPFSYAPYFLSNIHYSPVRT